MNNLTLTLPNHDSINADLENNESADAAHWFDQSEMYRKLVTAHGDTIYLPAAIGILETMGITGKLAVRGDWGDIEAENYLVFQVGGAWIALECDSSLAVGTLSLLSALGV